MNIFMAVLDIFMYLLRTNCKTIFLFAKSSLFGASRAHPKEKYESGHVLFSGIAIDEGGPKTKFPHFYFFSLSLGVR
jgi:hypothetical protein